MRRLFVLLALLLTALPASADKQDVKREIQAQQAAASDLQALDTNRVVADEITLLKTWLDEASNKPGQAREILERCLNQADLIRKKLVTAKLKAEAEQKEKAVRDAREKIKQTQKALADATVKKKAMELNAK
jgi:hypothetical protein